MRIINNKLNISLKEVGTEAKHYILMGLCEEDVHNNDRNSLKEMIKGEIEHFLQESLCITEQMIEHWIPFSEMQKLKSREKYDIIMAQYRKNYGAEGLHKLVEKYSLTTPIETDFGQTYEITSGDIDDIYISEKIKLSYKEKLDIVVQQIYQYEFGLGLIDGIINMNLQGIFGGYFTTTKNKHIWIQIGNQNIRLSFLEHLSDEEYNYMIDKLKEYMTKGISNLTDENGVNLNIVVMNAPYNNENNFYICKYEVIN